MSGMRRNRADQPTLITSAPQSSAEEFEKRKKKYAIMMASRAVCVLLAASFYRVSVLLAMAFVIAGAVLPWCAVIIANDRPPKRKRAGIGHVAAPRERALPSRADERVVDG